MKDLIYANFPSYPCINFLSLLDHFINVINTLISPTLNKNSSLTPYSHCSISLIFYSKIPQKTIYIHCLYFLSNSSLNLLQVCFHPHHTTEMVLIKVTSNLHIAKSNYQFSVLLLFDLSTEFDTVDHFLLPDTFFLPFASQRYHLLLVFLLPHRSFFSISFANAHLHPDL